MVVGVIIIASENSLPGVVINGREREAASEEAIGVIFSAPRLVGVGEYDLAIAVEVK